MCQEPEIVEEDGNNKEMDLPSINLKTALAYLDSIKTFFNINENIHEDAYLKAK